MTESKEQTNKLDLPEQEEQESDQAILNRRQFIGFGASAAVAALAFPQAAQAYAEFPGMPHKERGVTQKYTPTPPAPPSPPTIPTPPTPPSPSLTPPSDTSFVQPNVIASKVNGNNNYGTLTSKLNVVPKDYSDVGDSTTYVRAFEQVDPPVSPTEALAPGPTLCVNPGDSIELTVKNTLAANDDSTYCPSTFPGDLMNHPNCLNTINMHFHGLHVSPISIGKKDGREEPISAGKDKNVLKSSDDVLYELQPGKSHPYCPWLPAFHAPGTHWYHAHRHGSTAIQVAGGMVGAIIVKEPPGQEICLGAPDVVMVIQEEPQSLTNAAGSYVADLTPQEKLDRGIYERTGGNTGQFLVNGVLNPTLNVEQGEIQRWRIINANSTPRAFIGLELRKGTSEDGVLQTIYRVAVDGITLYGKKMDNPSVKLTQVPFAPGNRVDLLVDFRSSSIPAGTYTLWKATSSLGGPGTPEALATIKVSTTAYSNAAKVETSFKNLINNGIPTAGKPAYLDPIPTDVPKNTTPVVFQAAPGTPSDRVTTPGRGNFTINKRKYNDPPNLANIEASLNSSQEWIVANVQTGAGPTARSATHPLHIHVNPFLVVATATINPDAQQKINDIKTNSTPEEINQEIYEILRDLKKEGDDRPGSAWNSTAIAPNGTGIDPTIWWDTFPITGNTAYKIRHRFDDYWGNYVLHCHVLIHEDQGMMWNVQINNVDNKGANPCQPLLKPVEI